jgi:phospholipase C
MTPASDPIAHVVVLMFENRSFDHFLGAVPGVDGVDLSHLRSNREAAQNGAASYTQQAGVTRIDLDPMHELSNVAQQLHADGPCGGFVIDFVHSYPASSPVERQEVMNYWPLNSLPALHALATNFTVCDRWFSSVPASTWTNRFFVHSGTSLGRVLMPSGVFDANWHLYNQTTLYDRLNDAGRSWKIYFGDVPQSLVMVHQWEPKNAIRYRAMSEFFADCQGPADAFPSFAFIEPTYFGAAQNDQHPATDVHAGDALLADVYNAIRANAELWKSTLVVCLHDEHGGFFDHVVPGAATAPDAHTEEYTFDQYGLRVPAILISPWVPTGASHTTYDHTSILKYLTDKWSLGSLGARTAAAASFANVIGASMRTDTPASVPVSAPAAPAAAAAVTPPTALNAFQQSLVSFTQMLDVKTQEPAEQKVARMAAQMEGPAAQAQAAVERVKNFLAQQARAALP